MLSVAEAAELSGIGRNYLYNMCHTDNFPAMRIGKRFYINREKFIEWINDQSRSGGA